MIAKPQTLTAKTEIFYPETDGMPLPDGESQAPVYRRVVGTIQVHFKDVPGARVNGNTFIYYEEGNPRVSVSPDCYVVFGLTEAAEQSLSLAGHNTYLLWEIGKPPDFVMEIGSESTGNIDTGRKRDLYAELGVSEYWRYDPSGGEFYGEPLVGERLEGGEYRRIEIHHESDGRVWGHSETLNLDFWWDEGELRFWDPVAERWLLNHEEEHNGRLEAEARAQYAESRVAELEAELRRLRGE